jgi:class 3 adenylate cyclase
VGKLRLRYRRITDPSGEQVSALNRERFESFGPGILGVGDVSAQAKPCEALAAIFDLQGFTSFCSQIDPHLVLPIYLDRFLTWLFRVVSEEFKIGDSDSDVLLWSPLPFFAKFLGDGVLFLWECSDLDLVDLGNIVVSLCDVCMKYRQEFSPLAADEFVHAPSRLRCGIARGQVVPIGNGKDFVGPCINVASRLQKLGPYSFAFSRRGFDLHNFHEIWKNRFVSQRVQVRGVGEEELVFVLAEECSTGAPLDSGHR